MHCAKNFWSHHRISRIVRTFHLEMKSQLGTMKRLSDVRKIRYQHERREPLEAGGVQQAPAGGGGSAIGGGSMMVASRELLQAAMVLQQQPGGVASANQRSVTIRRHHQQHQQWSAAIADHLQMLLMVVVARGGYGERRLPPGATGSVDSAFSQGVHVHLLALPMHCQWTPSIYMYFGRITTLKKLPVANEFRELGVTEKERDEKSCY
ncbi:uncharacterized protein LOC112549253 [Alligator sinensis]|uniref:Uncharacterized protein LOC112549253 n=1 Tax=Alligator sinensis TaxID=38654 RepID=A0A3Q0G3D2_ALLSI|nr:uncharacterized protein LOC112549253 [Alligator sinensis]